MKKIILIAAMGFVTYGTFAQSAKVTSAYKYLGDYNRDKAPDYLAKAKEAIDLAAEHPDTKESAKTHVYRGQIYMALFEKALRDNTEKSSEPDIKKKEVIGYQTTPTNDLAVAYESFKKAKSVDAKGVYASETTNGINRALVFATNKGIHDYNAKNYASALTSFELAYGISDSKDDDLLNNCALTAELSQNYDKAKAYYQKLIDNKKADGAKYSSLANVYFMTKDTVGGLEMIKKGRAAFPNDIGLLITETNFYLKNNQNKEAIENLNVAVKAEPTNANLFLVRGNMYDNLANPKDKDGKDLEKPKDYPDLFKKAEEDYKKAIELKADYFDALYNLGALYNNNGVYIAKLADKITDNAKYQAENAKATEEFNKAVPVLEKAHEINPKDKNTMYALKQIYMRTQQMEKLKAINEKIKNN
jgi:tetratricopeptide (TPR) repeat protein